MKTNAKLHEIAHKLTHTTKKSEAILASDLAF